MVRHSLFLSILCLTSCSQVGGLVSKIKPGEEDEDFGKIPEIPSHLRSGGAASVTVEPAEERVVAMGTDPATLAESQGGVAGLPSEADIIFTDPDDHKGSEAAIQDLFGLEKQDWQESHSIAKNLSLVESKPLLIFFTDSPSPESGGSPAAARLESELISRTDFSEWAGEHFVRLKLDFNVKDRKSADSSRQSIALAKEKYLKALKKHYKVGGFPALIVVATDGSVVQHARGYRSGGAEFTWGLLRTALENSQRRQKKFEEKLEKKGYRRWTGKNDLRILARLASYKDGNLILIAPNGNRYETKESHLSAKDREWIQAQKEKRS